MPVLPPDLKSTVKSAAARAAGLAVACVAAVIGLAFLIAALWTGLAHEWGSAGASIALGLGFLVAATCIVVTIRIKVHHTRERIEKAAQRRAAESALYGRIISAFLVGQQIGSALRRPK